MTQTILITGGAGYIGTHLVKELSKRDCQLIVFDLVMPTSTVPGVEYLQGDITDPDWSDPFVTRRIDVVIHLAAKTSAPESVKEPELYQRVNSMGSEMVWRLARSAHASRVIFASSAAVYGDLGKQLAREDSPTSPSSPYGQTKLAGDKSLFAALPAPHCYSLRLFNVGGGDDKREPGEPTVLHALSRAKRDGVPFVINGSEHPTPDSTPVRDFVHVEDVALAFAHFATSDDPHPSGIYSILGFWM